MDWIIYGSMPIVTAFIGWLTNKLAIKMLFHPRKKIRILGFDWQGLIPRRQSEVATNAGAVIEKEFLGEHWLQKEFEKVDIKPYLKELAKKLIRERLAPRLQKIPLVGSFINDSTISQFEDIIADEIVAESDPLIAKVANEFETHLDIKKIVEERINGFDIDKLEEVVHNVASKEFRNIELLGGVLGFIVGLLQILILFLTGNLAIS